MGTKATSSTHNGDLNFCHRFFCHFWPRYFCHFAIVAAFQPAFGLVSKSLDLDEDEDDLESESKSEEEEEPPG
jgi:hypothetical protein